jgi:hypothetical protein
MANDELKDKIIAWFQEKSKGAKKKFYMQDVTAEFSAEFGKRDVQKAVNACTVDGTLMYWSSGSTTMLVLPEYFPKVTDED